MLPFFLVRVIMPAYFAFAAGYCLVILSKLLTKTITHKIALKHIGYSFMWGILILTEKGREKLFTFKEA